jgi:hypothetical protein
MLPICVDAYQFTPGNVRLVIGLALSESIAIWVLVFADTVIVPVNIKFICFSQFSRIIIVPPLTVSLYVSFHP